MKTLLLAAALAVPSVVSAEYPDRAARIERLLPDLEQITHRYATAFGAPGVAVAIVTPDEVRSITFGVREAGRFAPITSSTVFQLASVSKPITATFAAALVSQGRLSWDTPIGDLLPEFTFADPSITRRTTVRDLLSQRSGLPGETGDFLETLGFSQAPILEKMRFVDTAPGFRKQWAYANFGITLGGNAAASVTGRSFGDALRRELFRPLGMRSSFVGHRRLQWTHNRARLHFTIDGVSRPLFIRDADAEAPGGGVNGSVRDLAALVQLYLNDGRVGGRQLIDPAVLRETYRPISDIGGGTFYGLCWNVSSENGEPVHVSHSGAFLAGARTEINFWPRERVGLVILTNSFPNLLPEALADAFHQLYTTGRVKNGTLSRFQTLTRRVFDVTSDVDRLQRSAPLLAEMNGEPLSAYAGVYENPYLGRVEIRLATEVKTLQPSLALHVPTRRSPFPILRLGDKLISTTEEGDPIEYEFARLKDGRFQELRFPVLEPIGWEKLRRVVE